MNMLSLRRTATADTSVACLREHLLPPPPRAECLQSPRAASVAGSRNTRGGAVDDRARVGAPVEGPYPLRRGAWYRVTEVFPDEVVLDVNRKPVTLPLSLLDLRGRLP